MHIDKFVMEPHRKQGVHFCESCHSLKRVKDKRVKVTKGWKCPDCILVKR
mgnify:CR=1 FL=1